MENKIAIVGSGHSAGLVANRLLELGYENVHIIEADQVTNTTITSEPTMYIRPYHLLEDLKPYYGGKQFKCKGKHQYRESNGSWVCECGRKL